MIKLFEASDTNFNTNGIGVLSGAAFCNVTEERNGLFELEMDYPITGDRYSEIKLRRIIMARPNPYDNPQPFRIYYMSKPLNGIVTIKAQHISYDLTGYPTEPFTAESVQEAFSRMETGSVRQCPFIFYTNKSTSASLTVPIPSSIRSVLGGSERSILNVYGGEYEFDRFNVKLHESRGEDRGVTIRYGKNLTDIKQEENCASVYTAVYPYWQSEMDGLVQLPEKIVKAPGTYDFEHIMPLDLGTMFYEKPTEEQLRIGANIYVNEHNIGIPDVSIEVSFVQLAQSEEYKNYAILETVKLCDTVSVEFPALGVSAKSKCIKTEYDVLTGKYTSIELGESRSNLATTISEQNKAIETVPTKNSMDRAIEEATQLIVGGLGGYVVLRSSSGDDSHPDELLVMDTDSIQTATSVWRWNKNGLGYSSNGYNGPYTTAITQDGKIVADFIKSGTMEADRIKGGVLSLGGFDDVNGKMLVYDDKGTLVGTWDKDGINVANGYIGGLKIGSEGLSSENYTTLQIFKDGTGKFTNFSANGKGYLNLKPSKGEGDEPIMPYVKTTDGFHADYDTVGDVSAEMHADGRGVAHFALVRGDVETSDTPAVIEMVIRENGVYFQTGAGVLMPIYASNIGDVPKPSGGNVFGVDTFSIESRDISQYIKSGTIVVEE